jgi:hypothetical protein
MRILAFALAFFTIVLSFEQTSWADEAAITVADLKAQMDAMQKAHAAEISKLRAEIKAVGNKQPMKVVPIDEAMLDQKIEEKLKGFGMEYVGRDADRFGKGGLLVRDHSGHGQVTVGGYADIEFENFENTRSTFDQHRWILNVGAELGERLKFYSEYEIEHGGPDASGDGEAKVEQAHIDYLINDAVNVRAGALLMPFGRFNIYHDSDLQDLTDRPLVNRDIIPTTWTESGAGFYGEFNPVIGGYEDLIVAYEAYVVNGLDAGFSDTGLRGARGSIEADNNNNKAFVTRLAMSPALGHEVGFSYYQGKINTLNDDIRGIAIDWFSEWGPLEILGEWAFFDVDEPAAATTTGAADLPERLTGGFLQANYHFWFDFLDDSVLGRSFEDPTFTFVNRLGYAEIEDDLVDGLTGDNTEWRYTIGLNYRPVESWVLKLEYQQNSNDNENLERGSRNGVMGSIAMGF